MARPTQRLIDIAEEQWGLITRRQALAAGVAPTSIARQLADGRLDRVGHGVYRIRGAGEVDHLGLRVAWLQLDPSKPAWIRLGDLRGPVVSHTSAADLYGVGDLRADVHEFTLHVRRQSRRADVRLHRAIVQAEQRTIHLGLPITRAARMVADLLADHIEPSAVGHITAEVIDRVLDYPANIAEQIAPRAARFGFRRGDGVALLDHLLALADYKGRAEALAEARAA